ncbi:hypothetical protein NH8B_1775 [Pseudogulbenkiania sp. NH8B]|uniref:eCIS core domain-containing protein n=1 Tax=Pseudogulbenkiania sp. (strain NH8B) TaxID=748280 RepID=UPI0002279DDD|nr:DUF4157 domain-containing protein [Pseudogulbenkiania sp. NH8B]BAK76592.1 hypothetical protein NH8B_1775 [Pseudogulbenkiania sp. NH8B]
MAEHVLTPQAEREPPVSKASARGLLQRKCACGANAGGSGECETCAAQNQLQRHASRPVAPLGGLPASVGATLGRPGRPLDADTRHFMEDRFGSDFGSVRIHDDSAAAASARDVDAHAYTVGQNIVFGDGQYQPHSESGRHLLAHELAHTVQQQGLQRAGISSLADQGPDYQRLEREADFAADRVMSGQPLPNGVLSQGGPRLSRKPATPTVTPPAPAATPAGATPATEEKDPAPGFTAEYETSTYNRSFSLTSSEVPVQVSGSVSKTQADYEVEKLVLPAQKGPYALALCNKPYRPLTAVFEWAGGVPKPYKNIPRDPTDTLQRTWLSKYGYKLGKEAHKRWKEVGGESTFPKIPNGPTCEIDHVQELQVGGDNNADNLQVLDKVDNGSSGNLIQQQLRYLASAAFDDAKTALGNKRPKRVSLSFKGAVMQGSPKCSLCCQLGQRFNDPSITAASGAVVVDFDLIILGNPVKLKLPADKSKSIPLAGSPYAENKAAAGSIKGLTLVSFERDGKGKGRDKIRASIDGEIMHLKPNTKGGDLLLGIGPDGALLLPKGKPSAPIKFEYTKLSPGQFTSLTVDSTGISAEGTIKPSIPLLPTLNVAMDANSFRVTKGIDKDKIKPPFPGVKVTEASIALELAPVFKPVGTLALEFGAGKKLADLKLTASADDAGLVLKGDLLVYLPGIDQAKGEVKYQGGEWSGGAHIESGQMAGKIPYVKSGSVDVWFKAGKIDASGKVNLELPGNNEATLELNYTASKWVFQGRGRIKVKNPYLKPIQASLWYDGELFIAKGQAGFAFSGLDGTVDATYENKGGKEKVYGKGDIKIDKGKAKGNIVVELHPNEKISGKGRLSYEIKKDLVATAGITIDEHQKITFDGELSFPDIKLFGRFPEKQEDHTIFQASGSIPIPGASIGNIGLKVKLWGSLGYYYYVGPGVLTGVKATVKFSPFEDNPDFSFTLQAKASIPAGGGITGRIGADVVIDAYIAEVGGGLNVSAKAGLEGKAELSSEIAYSKDKFSVDASAYIGGNVVLAAALCARVYAEAGVWRFKVRTEKSWELLGGKFDTGLGLGVRLPLHYDSVEGFRMPRLSDIKPEPSELKLDPSRMLSSLFGDANKSDEREAGSKETGLCSVKGD